MRTPLYFLAMVPLLGQASSVLNMSHDLTTLGIAQSNLTPNSPNLDARPLFEQAVAYASKNGIPTVVADPGSYYFLTERNSTVYALISGVSNVTIDWQNSDLYFKFSNVAAIQLANCTSVTMQNFTLDFQQLPFTQVTVTSASAAEGRIAFQTIPGYPSPADFNTNRTADGSDTIYLFAFRNGVPLDIGRLVAGRPVIANNIITIVDLADPWAQENYLSLITPGDTLVWTDRGGPPALNIVGGQNITIHNASIYSSGQIGLYFGRTANATADHVQVIPRPGTTRLISTNADGIHISYAQANSNYSNNIVRRTCDDALAMSAEWIASVDQASTGSTVMVHRFNGSPFPVGAPISFINPADASVVATANITAESPSFDQQTFTNGELITLTLDRALALPGTSYGVVDADPDKRGNGSVIRNNLVQEGVFSRGIWLSGLQNVKVHDNFVQRTSNIGVFVQQLSANLTDTGPSSGITIQNNLVDSALNYGGVSAGPIVAAASIHVVSENNQNAQVAGAPNANISVIGNRVTNSPRSAIRLENVNGGQISGNTIQGYALAPDANVYFLPSCCETLTQYLADFMLPVLATNTTGVVPAGNTVASTSASLVSSSSTASASPKLAVNSLAAAYGSNLAANTAAATLPLQTTLGSVTVQFTDSAGTSKLAPLLYVSANQVNYQVPDGLAPGIAAVTIGSSTGSALIDALAPGLYSASGTGSGVAAALAALYSTDGMVTPENLVECSSAGCTAVPMSLGNPTDQLIVSLFGTGLRNFSSLQNAMIQIGGAPAQILFVGAQSQYPGLDQINVVVPRSLAGAGEVPIVLTLDGQTANVVTLSVQ
jgi:uncharacterized protein (TIGR03437 family)